MIINYVLRVIETRWRLRKTFIPDASNLGGNQLGFRPLNRFYDAPLAEIYPRKLFPPWLPASNLGGDQIPELRLFRSYIAPDPDPGGRRVQWLPDNSSLGNDQTSHLKTSRLYLAPDADLGGRRGKWLPDNSALGGDQTSHLKTFRLYVAPDADLGGRRGVWLPDNSNLGGDQIPWFRRSRLYESPTAEIYPSRGFSQATAAQVADQLGWIRLNRLGVAAIGAEVMFARNVLFSAAAEVPGIEEERVRVGGFYGIQVPDVYVGGV